MSRNPKSPAAAIPASIRDRSIVLVGLMGSGKSTIGRRLAQRLGMRFADADDEIERAAGREHHRLFGEQARDHATLAIAEMRLAKARKNVGPRHAGGALDLVVGVG